MYIYIAKLSKSTLYTYNIPLYEVASRLCRLYRCSQRCLRLIYYIIIHLYIGRVSCELCTYYIPNIIIMFSIRLRDRRDYNTCLVRREISLLSPPPSLPLLYYIISSTFTFEMIIIVSSVLTCVRVRRRAQVVLLGILPPPLPKVI